MIRTAFSSSSFQQRCARASWACGAALVLSGCAGLPGLNGRTANDPVGPSAPGASPAPAAPSAPARPAAPGSAPPGAVSVTHADLPPLAAARADATEADDQRRAWVDDLAGHLAERAATALAADQRLNVHLHRVQRAGADAPWQTPPARAARNGRDGAGPRIELDFQWRTTGGQVLGEGRRTLSEAAAQPRPAKSSNDPLLREKALIDAWVSQELGRK